VVNNLGINVFVPCIAKYTKNLIFELRNRHNGFVQVGVLTKFKGNFIYLTSVLTEWFGNKNFQLLKAGGALATINKHFA
jgi:hypothetical protein